MSTPNKNQTFKRMSINLPEELDRVVLDMRMKEEYVRCSYVELIRILMYEGAKSLGIIQNNGEGEKMKDFDITQIDNQLIEDAIETIQILREELKRAKEE